MKDYSSFIKESNRKTEFFLSILENYLYKCILDNTTTISNKQLEKLLNVNFESTLSYDLFMDSKLMSIIRLIGWTGIKCQNDTYIALSIELLQTIKTTLIIHTTPILSERSCTLIQHEIEYLSNYSNVKFKLQLQNHQKIYSIYESIFRVT